MEHPEPNSEPSAAGRGEHAQELVAGLFAEAGWKVRRPPPVEGVPRPDLVVRRGSVSYAVEVKAAPEGRGDRLIPLWSQACLQAARAAGPRQKPLAIVVAPRIARRVADQVLRFAAEHAPDAGAGVVDFAGRRAFRGERLSGLDAAGSDSRALARVAAADQANRFPDANQWMLKVLLAPGLPERVLSAPRARYRNAPELAAAAELSVMSAHRFLRQLRLDGFLDESAGYLQLVRRSELFSRWQSAVALQPPKEVPVRVLIRGSAPREMRRLMARGRACFALFAAADALRLGFVKGVAPCIYVPRLHDALAAAPKYIAPADPGEAPGFILREALAPRSIFGGSVVVNGRVSDRVCDVIQIWLDVAAHPARGHEQAELIRKRVLERLIREPADE